MPFNIDSIQSFKNDLLLARMQIQNSIGTTCCLDSGALAPDAQHCIEVYALWVIPGEAVAIWSA